MKIKRFILGITLAAFTSCAFGQYITGTPHDMSAATWNLGTTTNRLCGTCHTPHNSMVIAQAPLWSHDTSTAAYSMYTSAVSSTFNATPGTKPDGNSKLCLSCHDGTVALNDYIGAGTPNSTVMTGPTLVGTNLSNDHPISFTYDAALVALDGGLHPITNNVPALGGTISEKMLFGGKMQCASCHDAHNNFYTNFQRMPNTSSQLCLTCHNK